MADTVPVHNQMSVNLSLLCDDAVTGGDNGIAAAADGSWLTAAKRNVYLHSAYRWLVNVLVDSYGIAGAADVIPGFVANQTMVLSATGLAINKNYMYPLRLYKSASPAPGGAFMLSKRASLDDDFMPFVNVFYAIEAGLLYAYQRDASTQVLNALDTVAAKLFYLKSDRVDATTGTEVAINTAPDTTLDKWATDACLYYAAGRACFDKSVIDNDPAWADKGNRFFAAATAMIPKQKTIP